MVWPGGFGLYIHWPFCVSKCPYCDFNSHVADAVDHDRWRAALIAELRHYAAQTTGRRLDSIFFGGGTPSLMDPATTKALIELAQSLWTAADDLEITLEANPGTIDAGSSLLTMNNCGFWAGLMMRRRRGAVLRQHVSLSTGSVST